MISSRDRRYGSRWWRFYAVAAAGVLLLQSAMAGEIYKWVDEAGKVHFGDRPPPAARAEQLEVRVNAVETAPATEVLERFLRDRPAADERHTARKVTIYATQSCGYCRQAKAYLDSRGIPYTEYDIERSASARQSFQRLGGDGVPLLLVGDRRMSGFSPQSFERLYDRP